MGRRSAGLVMYRIRAGVPEFLVVHPGGPFWRKKDICFIPKGTIEPGESDFDAAQREFREETGFSASENAAMIDLGETRQRSGKVVRAWGFEGDCDPSAIHSVLFEMEWPPRSGRMQSFPETDRAEFMNLDRAREKVHPPEFVLIERLAQILAGMLKNANRAFSESERKTISDC